MSEETEPQVIKITVPIARKQSDLPRYVVIPALALASWQLSGTTVVEMMINDLPVERRNIKKWDADRWFISITATDCRRLNLDVGDRVNLALRLGKATLPQELAALLRSEPAAKACWDKLSASQQRMLREEIGSAKQAATRVRRARKALLRE